MQHHVPCTRCEQTLAPAARLTQQHNWPASLFPTPPHHHHHLLLLHPDKLSADGRTGRGPCCAPCCQVQCRRLRDAAASAGHDLHHALSPCLLASDVETLDRRVTSPGHLFPPDVSSGCGVLLTSRAVSWRACQFHDKDMPPRLRQPEIAAINGQYRATAGAPRSHARRWQQQQRRRAAL